MCPGRQRVLLFSSVLFYLIIQFWLKFCLCPAIRYNPTGNLLQRKLPLMSNCKKLPQIQWVSIKHAPSLTDRELEREEGQQMLLISTTRFVAAKLKQVSSLFTNGVFKTFQTKNLYFIFQNIGPWQKILFTEPLLSVFTQGCNPRLR